jgi:titin
VGAAAPVADLTFTTAVGQPDTVTGTLVVPEGYCSISWSVQGGSGGNSSAAGGNFGVVLTGATSLDGTATSYALHPGTSGTDGNNGTATPGTGGTNGLGEDGGDGIVDGMSIAGGGGGAASTVVQGSMTFLSAPGGQGGGGQAPGGSAGGVLTTQPGVTQVGSPGGQGVISGTVQACSSAPQVNWVLGDDHALIFQMWRTDGATITGVQYSLDGGAWTTVTTEVEGNFQFEGTIPGLITFQDYAARLRFVTSTGYSQPSDAITAAPLGPAPTNVRGIVEGGSIRIVWDPPTDPTRLVGYRAFAMPTGDQHSGGVVECPAMDVSTGECTVVVPAGRPYTVGVRGLYPDPGLLTRTSAGVVPAPAAPATVPEGSGSLGGLTGNPSVLAPGATVTLTGFGFAPNSTVSLYLYSSPVLLDTVDTDVDGEFSQAVTIPADSALGDHHLVAAGLDASADPLYLTSAIRLVTAGGPPSGGAPSGDGPTDETLAFTGFDAGPITVVGVLTLLAGTGLLLIGRKRRTA